MWEMTKGNRVAGQILNILKKVYAFQLGIMENRHKRKCGKSRILQSSFLLRRGSLPEMRLQIRRKSAEHVLSS